MTEYPESRFESTPDFTLMHKVPYLSELGYRVIVKPFPRNAIHLLLDHYTPWPIIPCPTLIASLIVANLKQSASQSLVPHKTKAIAALDNNRSSFF